MIYMGVSLYCGKYCLLMKDYIIILGFNIIRLKNIPDLFSYYTSKSEVYMCYV